MLQVLRRAAGVLVVALLAGCGGLVEAVYLNAVETTRFEMRGGQLHMDGTINSRTPEQLREILAANPGLSEIVMHQVPGSVDDEANLQAARMVRRAGLSTRLLAGSEVASGGTDFFIAGARRFAAPGARIGVHSWATAEGEAGDFARDDAQHQLYLNYYAGMGIPAGFYWFTLETPAAEIHWMSRAEMRRFGLISGDQAP